MYITENAKVIIDGALAQSGVEAIKLSIVKENGLDTIALELGNVEEGMNVTEIDGVKVIADELTLVMLEPIIFDGEEGQIVLKQMQSSCGSGSGGCGGCCGGCGDHDHGHEEGGCGCC